MAAVNKVRLTGWIITIVVSLMFLMSGVMKFAGGKEVQEGMAKLGFPASMLVPLGILELACIIIYLIPITSLLGAILMTGYIGGVILTHWRAGESLLIPIILGLVIWLGLYLREERLRELLPLIRRRP